MIERKIQLPSVKEVKDFVSAVSTCSCDIDISADRYIIDAKSIMGIFSLDLLSPITLTAYGDDCDKLFEELKDYIVE